MRFLLGILLVVLGTSGVLGTISWNTGCSCIKGYLVAKQSTISVPDAFRKFKLTPDFVKIPPNDTLKGSFATANVEIGQFIDPLRTIDPLYVVYPNGKANVNYTLFLLDFDGPRGDAPNAYVIGIDVNVPNSKNLIFGGDIVVPFIPPVPSLGTGVHRPAGLLYEQKDHVDPNDEAFLKLTKSRIVQLDQFAKTYNLNPVPVAGNFYTTELSRCLL